MKTTTFKKKSGLGDIAALAGLAYGASKLMGGGKPDLVGDTAAGGSLAPDKVADALRNSEPVSPAVPPATPPAGASQAETKAAKAARTAPAVAAPVAPTPSPAVAAPAAGTRSISAPPMKEQLPGFSQRPSGWSNNNNASLPPTRTEQIMANRRLVQQATEQYGNPAYGVDPFMRKADGGTVDTCCNTEPRRSSRSFPKKGG